MPLPLQILAAALNAASIALLVYWGIAIFRFLSTRRAIPTARAGLELARGRSPAAPLCVIIPAHNEQVSIGALVDSLLAQDYPDLRIVLCLDRCTDDTAAIAREHIAGDARFTLLEIDHCPEGWAGKVNAIWQGVQTPAAGQAELLVFADADTIFHPSCLRACVALMEHRRLDLLSLLSTLSAERWFERTIQPIAGMELIRQYPIARANRPPGTRRRPFANGQFMLFRKSAYEAVGGHAAVKDELLEDIALARLMGEHNLATGLFLAGGMLHCRMYESYEAFRRGWKRIYTESAKLKVSRLRRASLVCRITGSILPAFALLNLLLAAGMQLTPPEHAAHWRANLMLAALGLLAWSILMAAVYRTSRIPAHLFPTAIAGCWIVADLLSEAARELETRTPVRWGGREYIREPR
jgi:glycosyltransferase involved in cell wall biosynthesis